MGIYHDAELAYGYECPEPDEYSEHHPDIESWMSGTDVIDGQLPYVSIGYRDGFKTIVALPGFTFSCEVPGAKTIEIPPIPEDYKERLDAELTRLGLEPPNEEPRWHLGGTSG